jgi:Type VI secretion system/phage-baseplate injector OB domain/Gp5 C-terminal repeat (3 copies)
MAGVMNLAKTFKPQGVGKFTKHEGVVKDNKDPDKLGRIKVKVKELTEGIDDKDLPWAIPLFAHVDGALGGDEFKRSGTFFVPRIGTKVLVEYQDGDPHHPIYSGYTVDDKSKLKEVKKNYPDRSIIRFSNGTFILLDVKTNECIIHSPGDMDIIVQGDVNTHVHGNMQEICADSKDKAIDKYFTGDKDWPIGEAKQSQSKNVKFQGLGKTDGSGNRHLTVTGDYTMKIDGDRITKIKGNDTTTIKGNQTTTIEGTQTLTVKGDVTETLEKNWTATVGSDAQLTVSGKLTMKASFIFLN